MRDYLSVSQINTFLLCPRKYRFRYIDQEQPEHRSIALALGSAVHSTLAWWQTEAMTADGPSEQEAVSIFQADWAAEMATGDVDLEGRDPVQVEELGMSLVEVAVPHLRELEVVSVDQRVDVPLVDPRTGEELPVPLMGFLDFTTVGGLGEIKTSGRKSKPRSWVLQLSAYSYALEQLTGCRPDVTVVQLVKTKVPKVVVETVEITRGDQAWFLEVASEVFSAVRKEAFPPNPSWACGRCEYRQVCRAAEAMAA